MTPKKTYVRQLTIGPWNWRESKQGRWEFKDDDEYQVQD